jgi:hypothetical protein
MIDAPDLLRDFLLGNAALTAIIGNRLWAEVNTPPEAAQYKPSQGAAIVFKSAGGGMEAADTVVRVRWQFKVYGPDIYSIRAAYLALVDCLHDTRGHGGILSSLLEVPGTMLAEPDTDWLFMLAFFETRMKSRLPAPI